MLKFLSIFLPLLLLPPIAESAYIKSWVSDKLEVTMRQLPNAQGKPLKNLTSGQGAFMLQTSDDGEWSLIETDSGERGWIPAKALTREPVSSVQLASANQKLLSLTDENRNLKEEKNQLNSTLESLSRESKLQGETLEQAKTELASVSQASSNALQIQSERDRLRESLSALQQELASTQHEHQLLVEDNRKLWFLIGAGVLTGGILIGLILPKLKSQRRSSWGSF